ncbi:hypothetical protein AVEN_172734-1 [Araneus ventricosus]|uniref:Uncharacterized protein n=1 Tax=Araneus ventricosus TaxID=182803 RepID=A0A4Y2BKN8_ARAVE|nr:hypothetical protein AVEN_172734-1 [Araneus ventricosus]
MIGSSVDYVRSGGMRNVPVTKAVEHLYATTAKFSGCVLLASRPSYSYPPRRAPHTKEKSRSLLETQYHHIWRQNLVARSTANLMTYPQKPMKPKLMHDVRFSYGEVY